MCGIGSQVERPSSVVPLTSNGVFCFVMRIHRMTLVRHSTLAVLTMALAGCAARAPHSMTGSEIVTTMSQRQKPRVVVTTDPELDDSNSLLRYLLYSMDFRTEGLVYASSQFHWRGDGKGRRFSPP